VIYHLALPEEWAAALEAGEYRRSTRELSLEEEGFIHCSFADQVERTGRAYYSDRDDVVLLTVDPSRVPSDLRIERAPSRNEDFPHIYGPIPVDAVIDVSPWHPETGQ
jgi:glutathione S-transferase